MVTGIRDEPCETHGNTQEERSEAPDRTAATAGTIAHAYMCEHANTVCTARNCGQEYRVRMWASVHTVYDCGQCKPWYHVGDDGFVRK